MVDTATPHRVGRYEILLPIATGGMATVYLARTTGARGFDRYLALKLTAPHLRRDPAFAEHLIDEAKLVAHLRHPNVVQSLDVGECEHGVYLVMDYVPGDSFAGLRRAARLAGIAIPKPIGLRILVDALKGLHAAHDHADEDGQPYHLVHRDFSPQNILVGTDGIARLTDFGIAKAISRVSDTAMQGLKGKLSYLSPEQARNESLDRRCDVWAAGVIAWEIMTGGKLYEKDDLTPVKPDRPVPPRLRTVVADVPLELEEVIARALRLDRDERTANAQAFGRALAAAATASNLLADTDEVAAFVLKLVGEELVARKKQLQTIRREQGERTPSLPDVRQMLAHAEPVAKRRDADSGDDGSDLRISVAEVYEAERADSARFGQGNVIPEEDPAVFRSPVVLTPAIATPAAVPSVGVSQKSPPLSLKPSWNGRQLSIAAIVGGALLGFAVVLVVALGRKSDAAVTPVAAAPPAKPAPEPSPAKPTAPALEAEDVAVLRVRANHPIASVKIGGRLVDAIVPAPTLSIELEEDERGRALPVLVTATNGRKVKTMVPGSESELEVKFPSR